MQIIIRLHAAGMQGAADAGRCDEQNIEKSSIV
jgi:hypothetical protein